MKDRLSQKTKTGYGAAEFGFVGALSLIQVYLLEFYITAVGLKPALAGLALALAVIWDGVSDPLMGILSDRTRTRIGRRLPYMIVGTALLAVSLALLFNPPLLSGQLDKFAYLLSVYLLFNTAATLFSVPYQAMGSEITDDSDERTKVYGWKRVFGNSGLLVGLLLPLFFIGEQTAVEQANLDAIRTARGLTADILALLIILFGAITLVTFYKREIRFKGANENARQHQSIKQTLLVISKNRPFVIITIASIVGIVGQTINSSMALLYYKYYLKLDEQDAVGKILILFILSLVIAVPFWTWVSRRISKKSCLVISGSLCGMIISVAYPLLPVGAVTPAIIIGMLGGFLIGAFFLSDALVADIINNDTKKTGIKKDASYFGFLGLSSKLSRAIGLALNGIALSLIGFKEQALTQSENVERKLSLIFGPGVGLFFILAVYIFSRISLEKVEEKNEPKVAV